MTPRVILDEQQRIVQLSLWDMFLCVSTVRDCYIVQIDGQNVSKIGSKPKKM